jgi:methionine-rich copper-binding protein CopC
MKRAMMLAALLPLWAGPAAADVVRLRESTPAAEAIVQGRNAQYIVRFSGPVNHAASLLEVVQGDKTLHQLRPRLDSEPDTLYAEAESPPPGRYVLRWQVRSATGQVSRGDIPFTVAQ